MYSEDDFLMLSGIQHYAFCKRQWALIHVENQWNENVRTVEGKILHKHAHDENRIEKRGDLIITRGLRIKSYSLGISGQCDIVEFHKDLQGIDLYNFDGKWLPYPVEYKKGAPKKNNCDELQLCAEAMCLEEMMNCEIESGALYYGEIRRRSIVLFDDNLRTAVKAMFNEMHRLMNKGSTPKAVRRKCCNACSLCNLCLPSLSKAKKVDDYIKEMTRD